jgi:hypothetical protein
VRRVRDRLSRREQHLDGRRRAGGARPREALDSRRALLGGRLPRRAPEVPAGDVPAVRRGAVRAGLPDLRQPPDRRRPQRAGLQPVHRHALLRQRLPLQRPVLRLLQPDVGQAAAPAAQPRRLAAFEVGVMEKCTFCVQRIKAATTRPGPRSASCGRRDPAGLRPGVPGARAGVRRPRRSRERGVAAGAIARGSRCSRTSARGRRWRT